MQRSKMWESHLKNLYDGLLNILYPRRCVACGLLGSYLCGSCLEQLPVRSNYREEGLLTLFDYDQPVAKKLIWLLKYKGVRDIAPLLADLIYEHIIEDLSEAEQFSPSRGKILIIPVPLSAKRQRQRGFNQSEEITINLVKKDPRLFTFEGNNLVKTKETTTQVSVKNRHERLINLRGAFLVKNRSKLRDKTIILIDDVSTTGTTLEEASKALRRARPRRIYKLVVAHG